MADRGNKLKTGSIGNGSTNGAVKLAAGRMARRVSVPAAQPGRKPGGRTTIARSDIEETFTRGFWASWGLPIVEAAALSFILFGAIAWLRPRDPAAALDAAPPSTYEIGFSARAESLAPPPGARGPEALPAGALEEHAAQDLSRPDGGETPDLLPASADERAARPATSRPSLQGPRAPAESRAAASSRTISSERRMGAETGKKRRTSVHMERREKKVETITRPPIIQKPRLRYGAPPAFPPGAREQGKTGRVRFRVQVTPTGSAGKVEILEADPPGVFDQAVKDALPLWQFAPARDEAGNGVESSYEQTIFFEVEHATS